MLPRPEMNKGGGCGAAGAGGDILNLHDCLSLGEVERGLSLRPRRAPPPSPSPERPPGGGAPRHPDGARHRRLPMLMRLLQEARPLSSVPCIPPVDKASRLVGRDESAAATATGGQGAGAEAEELASAADATVQGAVDRLEDAAAADPAAEAVEALVGAWAPGSARRLEGLLRQRRPRGRTGRPGSAAMPPLPDIYALPEAEMDEVLAELSASGAAPAASQNAGASSSKKKRGASGAAGAGNSAALPKDDDEDGDDDSDIEDEDGPEDGVDPDQLGGKKRRRSLLDEGGIGGAQSPGPAAPLGNSGGPSSRASLLRRAAGEDSHEASVTKTLAELVRLVRSHSAPSRGGSARHSSPGSSAGEAAAAAAPLLPDDSVFAQEEPRRGGASSSSGAVDLPSTVAALLHHAPLLPARSVAEAMCRSGAPQGPSIVARIGANSPSAAPCLISGCLDAASEAHPSSLAAARGSLRSLALLSPRESSRVRSALSLPLAARRVGAPRASRRQPALLDLRLELALASPEGALEAACLVDRHFAKRYGGTPPGENGSEEAAEDEDDEVDKAADENDGGDEGDATETNSKHGRRKEAASLPSVLRDNPALLGRALEVLCRDLAAQRREGENGGATAPAARFSLVLTAAAWLLHKVPLNRLLDQPHGREAFDSCLAELHLWVERFRVVGSGSSSNPDNVPVESLLDRPLRTLVCACFAGLSAPLLHDEHQEGDTSTSRSEACCSMITELLVRRMLQCSHCSAGYAARFLLCAGRNDASRLVLETLLRQGPDPEHYERKQPREPCPEACERVWACFTPEETREVCLGGISGVRSLLAYPAFGLDLAWDVMIQEDARLGRLHELLEHVLKSSPDASAAVQHPLTAAFVETATFALLSQDSSPMLPIVSPVELENTASLVSLRRDSKLSPAESRFILCLLYYFVVREADPKLFSIFPVDFRTLPVTKLRYVCEKPRTHGMSEYLAGRLFDYIDIYCPETRQKTACLRLSQSLTTRQTSITKQELLTSLRTAIDSRDSDPSGSVARRAFVIAKGCLPESTLITTAASALLSDPNTLPSYFTFASLYRDPLLLLKCTNSIWQSRGLRSVVVSLLRTLLTMNDYVVHEEAPSEDLRLELIDARNLLVLRSLVALMTTEYSAPSGSMRLIACPSTLGFIRRLIAMYPGLLAGMLKQGLGEVAIDWLVDWVPECAADSVSIINVLTERSALAAPERLVVADSALRVAVMHGALANDETTRQLVVASLSQLISSFFLVLGPVGVPVSSIIGPGHDATKISRKAAFRMLKTMLRVQSFRTDVRNECCVAVQKLMGLCKGENIMGGLSGALASRQKKLIKELMEALTRANNAMGGIVQV